SEASLHKFAREGLKALPCLSFTAASISNSSQRPRSARMGELQMTRPSRKFPICLVLLNAVSTMLPAPVRGHDQPRPAALAISSVTLENSDGEVGLFTLAAQRYVRLQRGSISGQVVLPSGQQVITRIKITLTGYRISPLTTYTDTKGRFSFQGVSDGTYT